MELEQFRKLSKEAADNLSRFVNCADDLDLKIMADAMTNDHRTLVQKKMRLCMLFIEKLYEDYSKGYFDLRDEHACKLAKKIMETTDRYDRMMPLI